MAMDSMQLLCGLNGDLLRSLGLFNSFPSFRLANLRTSMRQRIPSLPSMPSGVGDVRQNVRNQLQLVQERLGERLVRLSPDRGPIRKHIPVGSGEHTVGCVDLMSDHTVNGTFVRLYYPTYPTDIYEREAQWPLWLPRKQYGKGYAYFRRKNLRVFGTLMNKIAGEWYVPVLWQAPLLNRGEAFPLVVYSHGLGGNRTTYSTICSDLASHGFVVAAIEHRDGTASTTYCLQPNMSTPEEYDETDYRFLHRNHSFKEEQWLFYERQEVEDDYNVRNKQVHKRAKEISRVLDLLEAMNQGQQKVHNVLGLHFDVSQFKGMLDLERVSVVGHSFGGATTVATLSEDPRFKVGVSLDSWMLPLEPELYDKVTQPVLFVNTETFQWCSNVRTMYKLNCNSTPEDLDRVLITLRGTCHQSQTDFQFMLPSKFSRFMEFRDSTDPAVAMDLNQRATRGFLAQHLNLEGMPQHLDLLLGEHPLVIRGTNLDLTKDSEE